MQAMERCLRTDREISGKMFNDFEPFFTLTHNLLFPADENAVAVPEIEPNRHARTPLSPSKPAQTPLNTL
jgi:hypothetical protein